MNKSTIGWLILAAVLCIGLITQPIGCTNIAADSAGVEVNALANKVNPEPLNMGYHWYNRWTSTIVSYRVAARSYPADVSGSEKGREYTMELKTADGQNVSVDMTIIYSLRAKEVPLLHQTVGPHYEDQVLLPNVRSEARLAFGSYASEEIYQGKVREVIQRDTLAKLTNSLAKYPAILVTDVLVRHLEFSKDFEHAIEQKKLAAQQVEINKQKALAQEQEALRVEAEARGNKLKAVQQAEGEGQSMEAVAKGKAAAVKLEADAAKYKLLAEAEGNLAKYKAEAEGKRLSADALKGDGGKNVVNLKLAESIGPGLRIFGIPTGAQGSTSMFNLGGFFDGEFGHKADVK